jgi:hypothetical protein
LENKINTNNKMNPSTKRIMIMTGIFLPLILVIAITTLPHQVANAQLTPSQQTAINSLMTTGFTNQVNVTTPNGQTFPVFYSIKEGIVVAIVAATPTTSVDVIIAPTQYAKTYGVFTIKIPRALLDSKNPDGTDKAFRVSLDGHGLSWKEIQNTNSDRTLGLYFGASNGFLQIYGTQIAK